MVKKIKYIVPLLIFFLSLNVKAYNLNTPTSYYYDTSSDSPYYVSTSLDLWWGTNQTTDFYYHSSKIGDFGGATTPRIYRVDYNFVNANLCSGQDLSISGLLGGPGNFFDEQSWEVQIWSNGSPLACSFTRIAGNKIEYKCYGKGGGNLNYYFWEHSFTSNKNYMVGVNRNITYTCDVSNASIVEQSIINSQNIINNQNSNTNKIIQNQDENTQELKDSITSESQPNTNSNINDMNNMVASDTPISDLITMPLTLINAYINGVNSSCSPVNLGNLYGTDLILPCINLEQRLGTNLWHIIDSFFSIFMCYNIAMLFITAFDGITSLRDDFEGLYQPRHADTGYQPKHGG